MVGFDDGVKKVVEDKALQNSQNVTVDMIVLESGPRKTPTYY
jgi:hypothetical protein